MDCDVLICGLGPVGQLLALLLGDRGVATIAIDRAPAPYTLPRAAVIDDEVLRIMQSVGLDRAVLADAQVQPGASIVTAAGRPVEVFRSRTGPLGHPPLVSINQPSMERTLLAALAQRPSVEVRRGVALDVLDRRSDRVEAFVRPADGGPSELIRCRWLIGCDGAGSAVRARLQVPFDGRTAPQRWIVVDALVDRPLAKVPHPHFVGSAAQQAVTLPMSPGRHRWEWMLKPGEDAEPRLRPEAIGRAIAPWLDGETVEIERAVVYTFHTRTASRWRVGRVLLAGDAAHVMPPFAGQGFSSGARDAANLAWKLADVLAGAPVALLDSYEAERKPHVAAMQRLATTMGGLVQATDPRIVRARDALLHAIDGTRLQRWAATNVKPLPTYGSGAFARRPARIPNRRTAGTLFPQSDRLDDRLPHGWAAVAVDDLAASLLAEEGLPVHDAGADGAWLRDRGLTWALLRPDRFVFGAGRAEQIGPVCAAWRALAAPVGAVA
ncbi:bifunctional 3-(3-hydroxy-phenyl)propionate/3-hydroxycinnamic acid hydroxylase [Conexibacter stalactiti]|uniref:Bifunctional 3-(3-hydroxy-phenyl)propionate/3-hydroxycinnamic acid hydroxylase n=1 Tax=Conexibacter stalactiti TaxID=1940611 RepID=A0ABU4HIG0_9ACTN|nr:bifunctional 3-(3-hydroxy-phenyl)propionate/3-hydroxycinnamic acid hydroxylase [Conexibacter stalactiti]MDW5593088.1 bifunctional 3-(3-hydroxy-phenyl)propionate/3-hydroxycinnamic acid hydroxylase [Conexibacter stalactiti]MEC5033729.1 bifunctional 3-(3-hydroxy-phenyl)propionate/3-hydroxycinnamic acid hydroxylase [Conexibacter stalactiti]